MFHRFKVFSLNVEQINEFDEVMILTNSILLRASKCFQIENFVRFVFEEMSEEMSKPLENKSFKEFMGSKFKPIKRHNRQVQKINKVVKVKCK